MAANRSLDNYVFFENQSTTGSRDYIVTSDASQIMLKIVSNGTFSIKLTADTSPKSEGNLKPYYCFKIPDLTKITDVITDGGYLYSVDLTDIDYLRVEIVSITNTLSIYGKVVG